MFPNHDVILPGADFIVYSAEGPRKADFDPSALYKGTLECKEIIIFVLIFRLPFDVCHPFSLAKLNHYVR